MSPVRYIVFFLVASLVMGSAHWYVYARLVRDAGLPSPWGRIVAVVIALLFVALMTGFMVARVLPRSVTGPWFWVSYTWLGVLFFMIFSLAAADLARVITLRVKDVSPDDPERRLAISRFFAGAAAVVGLGASGVGVASALSRVAINKVKVSVKSLGKDAEGMRIVQISDVHVGPTIGKTFIEDIVARINALKPDVVAITGDLVDGSVEDLREHVAPLGKIEAKHGVYFVTGNHEYYSGHRAWIAHLATLGIKTLQNERVRIGGEHGFDLAGIDDPTGDPDLAKALEGRDKSRGVVLLAHQPRAISLADELGVDLQLSGHTHGGQMFPWNLFVRLQQPFVAGLHQLSHAQIYVSCGTGYWGPPMRVGTTAEITEIELSSKKDPAAASA